MRPRNRVGGRVRIPGDAYESSAGRTGAIRGFSTMAAMVGVVLGGKEEERVYKAFLVGDCVGENLQTCDWCYFYNQKVNRIVLL